MSVERLCGEELMEMDDLLLEKDLALEENTEVVEDKPKEEDQQKCPLDPSSPCENVLLSIKQLDVFLELEIRLFLLVNV